MPLSIPYTWSEEVSSVTLFLHFPVQGDVRRHPFEIFCSPLFIQISQPHTKAALSLDLCEEIKFEYSTDENGIEKLPYEQVIRSLSAAKARSAARAETANTAVPPTVGNDEPATEVELTFHKHTPGLWKTLLYSSPSSSATFDRRRASRERAEAYLASYAAAKASAREDRKKSMQQRTWDWQKQQREAMEKVRSDERVMALEEIFGAKKSETGAANSLPSSKEKDVEESKEQELEQEHRQDEDEEQGNADEYDMKTMDQVEETDAHTPAAEDVALARAEEMRRFKARLAERSNSTLSPSPSPSVEPSLSTPPLASVTPALPPVRKGVRLEVNFTSHRPNAPAREEKDLEDPRWKEWMEMQEQKKEKEKQDEEEKKKLHDGSQNLDEKQLVFMFEKAKNFFNAHDHLSAQSLFSSFLSAFTTSSSLSSSALSSVDPLFFFQSFIYRARISFQLALLGKSAPLLTSDSALLTRITYVSQARAQLQACMRDSVEALKLIGGLYPRKDSPMQSSEVLLEKSDEEEDAVIVRENPAQAVLPLPLADSRLMSEETRSWMLSGIHLGIRTCVTLGELEKAVHLSDILSFFLAHGSSFPSSTAFSTSFTELGSSASSVLEDVESSRSLLLFRQRNQATALTQKASTVLSSLTGTGDGDAMDVAAVEAALEDLNLAVRIDPSHLPALLERCKLMLRYGDLQGCVVESTYIIALVEEQRAATTSSSDSSASASVLDEFYFTAFLLRAFSCKSLGLFSAALSDYSILLSIAGASSVNSSVSSALLFVRNESAALNRELLRRKKMSRASEQLSKRNLQLARELVSEAIHITNDGLAGSSKSSLGEVPLLLQKSVMRVRRSGGQTISNMTTRTEDSLDLTALKTLLSDRAGCFLQMGAQHAQDAKSDCERALSLSAALMDQGCGLPTTPFDASCDVEPLGDLELRRLISTHARKSQAECVLGEGWLAKEDMTMALRYAERRQKLRRLQRAHDHCNEAQDKDHLNADAELDEDVRQLEDDLHEINVALDQSR